MHIFPLSNCSPVKNTSAKRCLGFLSRTARLLRILPLVFFKSFLNVLSSRHHEDLLVSCLAIYILPYLKWNHFAAEIAILCCVHVCVYTYVNTYVHMHCFSCTKGSQDTTVAEKLQSCTMR